MGGKKHLLSLSAVHLKGTINKVADFLSRQKVQEAEWSLNSEVFALITRTWGHPQVDLFASRQNTQLPQFFSLHRDDSSQGIDALAHPWNFHLGYAFPPFQLIPLVLRKIQKERVSIFLITPFWPKRAWFSTVLQMAIKPFWQLPLKQDLLET